MIILLSPAKSLDFQTEIKTTNQSQPVFQKEANKLASRLRELSPKQITDLMNISTRLANLNYERFQNWKENPRDEDSRQAIFAFKGDVYQGLEISEYNKLDLEYAQENLRILSGMYGILRPLDMIQAYRLEMGTGLKVGSKENLYAYWSEKVTEQLQKDLSSSNKILLNLASQEYFKTVKTDQLNAKIITPAFKDNKDGKYKIISFYAKKARGKMTSFLLRNRIRNVDEIRAFEEDGYVFNPEMSTEKEPVFTRG